MTSGRARLADVELVFASVAADPVCPLAFINEIAVAIALSEFRVALRGRSEPRGFRSNYEQECHQRRKPGDSSQALRLATRVIQANHCNCRSG